MSVATRISALAQDVVGLRRRRELANFLRVKRERMDPAGLGFASERRRVRGLRREEVAERAGISASWYTWLEQARDIRVSPDTLDRLAGALGLHAQEREQLYLLAELPPPRVVEQHGTISETLHTLVQRFDPWPAYVVCSRWDVVDWNRGAVHLFGDFGALPLHERNFLWLLFTNPEFRARFVEGDRMTACVLAWFRAVYHERLSQPEWRHLVETLERENGEFRERWREYSVLRPPDWRKEMQHPELGRLVFDPVTLSVPPHDDMRVMFYQPADHETERRWQSWFGAELARHPAG